MSLHECSDTQKYHFTALLHDNNQEVHEHQTEAGNLTRACCWHTPAYYYHLVWSRLYKWIDQISWLLSERNAQKCGYFVLCLIFDSYIKDFVSDILVTIQWITVSNSPVSQLIGLARRLLEDYKQAITTVMTIHWADPNQAPTQEVGIWLAEIGAEVTGSHDKNSHKSILNGKINRYLWVSFHPLQMDRKEDRRFEYLPRI